MCVRVPRPARPRRATRRPAATRRTPAYALRAVDIDSRRDRRHTPPTTRSRSINRRPGRGTPCAVTFRDNANRNPGTHTCEPRASRRGPRCLRRALRHPVGKYRSNYSTESTCTQGDVSGGAGRHKDPLQCRPESGQNTGGERVGARAERPRDAQRAIHKASRICTRAPRTIDADRPSLHCRTRSWSRARSCQW
jgi:hypothetical protein